MRNRCAGRSLCPCNLSVSGCTRTIFGGTRARYCLSGGKSCGSCEDRHSTIRPEFTGQPPDFLPRRSFLDATVESQVPVDRPARMQLHPPLLILLSLSF